MNIFKAIYNSKLSSIILCVFIIFLFDQVDFFDLKCKKESAAFSELGNKVDFAVKLANNKFGHHQAESDPLKIIFLFRLRNFKNLSLVPLHDSAPVINYRHTDLIFKFLGQN